MLSPPQQPRNASPLSSLFQKPFHHHRSSPIRNQQPTNPLHPSQAHRRHPSSSPIFPHHLPSIAMDHTRNMWTMDFLGEPTCRNLGSKLKNFREGKDTEEGAWNNGGGE